ncbi:MAG: phage terminase large subunit [Cyanobacteria bacterium P01_C01_bin.120]
MALSAIAKVQRLKAQREKLRKQREATAKSTKFAETKTLPLPQVGPQASFTECDADIVLYGGSAGSGKTFAELIDFARPEFIQNPDYTAVIFRRTYPQITAPGGLADESSKLYPVINGKPKDNNIEWHFPSGARIEFRHLQHEKNIYDWQGAQITRIGWDELTHFTESQFFYLLSRNRSTSGIKPQMRMTCNPDADSWVAKFIDWWIDDATGYPNSDRSGIIRWFIRLNDEVIWGDSQKELQSKYPESMPKSFTFIAAKITDNPILLKADPGYLANLKALHPVEQERLLKGNWKIRYGAGKLINREWFQFCDAAPSGVTWIRFWDLAATAKEVAKQSHFYTAGVLIGRCPSGNYYLKDAIAEQVAPGNVKQLIRSVAEMDGPGVMVRWEMEGGSSGKIVADDYQNALSGFNSNAVKPMGDKVTRFIPVATAASNGNVYIVRGEWNVAYLNALVKFDGSSQPLVNDFADATSGGYSVLIQGGINNISTAAYEAHSYSSVF